METVRNTILALAVWAAPQAWAEQTNAPPSRPRIGLALGGGGALGFAHIGVLKVLEEARVPIDCIAGTSMGSIIGGLYASGLSPDEIQSALAGLNWDDVMLDQTPRKELYFRRKFEDERYLFEMGLGRGRPMMGMGMAAGQKLNNVLQFMTLRTEGVTNFNELPIPYRAVATDLESGTARVLDRGNLAQAMRASMAVPGVFTPVEIDGRLLVDGGVVNNLPVDIVRAMGADIVIAVDVGSGDDVVDPAKLRSLGSILGRTYSIAQRPGQLRNFRNADIGIQPPLQGFSASQFNRVAELAPAGERAAREKMAELSSLGLGSEEYARHRALHRRPPPEGVLLRDVQVTGNRRVSGNAIRGRIRTKPGDRFEQDRVRDDLMDIYGLGEFEQVLFTLEPEADGSGTLVYETKEKDWGPIYFKYGLRLQTDFEREADWVMLLNLTRMSINPLGGEWRNDLEFGSRQDLVTEFYQPLDYRGLLFVAPRAEFSKKFQDVYRGDDRLAQYEVTEQEARLDFGAQFGPYAEFRAGPFWGQSEAGVDTGSPVLPDLKDQLFGYNVSLFVDRQDRTLFARQGYAFKAEGRFCREQLGGDADFDKLSLGYLGQKSRENHTVLLGLRYGTSLGSELPPYEDFTMGGPFGFAGLAEEQFRGDAMAIASAGYRYRLVTLPSTFGRGVYAITRFDTGNAWRDDKDFDPSDRRNGFALGLGADTILGPMLLAYGLAEGGYDRWYFSLGTAF